MDKKLRELQLKTLRVFSKSAKTFALCGGTALELYYLKHRFSADLDFFSPSFKQPEIENIINNLKTVSKSKIKLENELFLPDKARVRFYSFALGGSGRPLKIDFVEDLFFKNPDIKKIDGVRVYSVNNIYLQKILAITGSRPEFDEIGREVMQGRRAAKDIFDIYCLSKKIMPLHKFLKSVSGVLQRGMVHWYRSFSRQELKLGLLDLDIYDKKFDSQQMIIYLENEIKKFIAEAMY
ncbi:MAG: nucleotidyl transferase AbiEii/AbiGii toxin family protein [Candidatus Omnitrophica bacterium]|jgi:predicted nucleotidyltransferase component of viral defense system|nr:nucleotidyl transferase AbiEii/AbiGii toxin family protein [Candidatus Omnitrophota bacterium]